MKQNCLLEMIHCKKVKYKCQKLYTDNTTENPFSSQWCQTQTQKRKSGVPEVSK